MNNFKSSVKMAFDDIAYIKFREAELRYLNEPTEQNYAISKEFYNNCLVRGIDIKTYKIND